MLSSVALISLAAAAVPADAIELSVEVDAPRRVLRLGRLSASIAFPTVEVETQRDRLRLHLSAPGPVPSKWRLEVEEWDPAGRRLRSLRAIERQGRGRPPLFVDFVPDRPPAGAYVAWLEVTRDLRDEARSAFVVLPAPGAPPARDRVLAVLPEAEVETRATGLRDLAQDVLRHPRARLELRGHWTPGEDADDRALDLARRAQAALRAGLQGAVGASGGDRLRVASRGATAPRFPNLSPRLAARNRRVEVVRVVDAVPPPKGTRTPPREPRSLVLTIDGRRGAVNLTEAPRQTLTLDLRPPAQIGAVLHDGFGAQVSLRRVADARGMVLARGRPAEATRSATVALAGPLGPRGGAHRLTNEGRRIEAEVTAPDATVRWRLEVRLATPLVASAPKPASQSSVVVVGQGSAPRWGETGTPEGAGALVAVASGEGPPPPRLSIPFEDRRLRTTAARVRLVVEGPAGTRRVSRDYVAPPLDIEPWGAWIEDDEPLEVSLAEAAAALRAHPAARLTVVLDGGRPASRRALVRRLERWAEGAGLTPARWRVDAGQERGRLVLRVSVEASAPLAPPDALSEAG